MGTARFVAAHALHIRVLLLHDRPIDRVYPSTDPLEQSFCNELFFFGQRKSVTSETKWILLRKTLTRFSLNESPGLNYG